MIKEIVLLLLALVVSVTAGRAQQPQQDATAERIAYISKTLAVPKSKATEIVHALDYNAGKILETIRNRSMNYEERHALLKKMYAERRVRVREVLTTEQLQKLAANAQDERETQRIKRETLLEAEQKKQAQRSAETKL